MSWPRLRGSRIPSVGRQQKGAVPRAELPREPLSRPDSDIVRSPRQAVRTCPNILPPNLNNCFHSCNSTQTLQLR